MKNYLTNYNRSNSPFDFIDSAFDDLFRPLFYDEKLDAMKTDIRETKDAYILDVEMPGFEKSEISMDGDADEDSIKAKYDKGVLTVTLPKKEEEKPAPKKSIVID